MIRCSVKPYEGDEGYVFISYSHGDKDRVYPLIERMAADGCRVWYDEGITPGEEWPESIGRHLAGCAAFIAFVSRKSAESDNCRREIIFAQRKHKPFFSVILEDLELTPGLEMQLSAYQSLYLYLLRDEEEFFEKFYKTDFADLFRTLPEKPKEAAPEKKTFAVQENPTVGVSYEVPAAEAAPEVPAEKVSRKAPAPEPVPEVPAKPAVTKKSVSKGKIIAAAAAAVLLIGGGITAIVLNSGKDKVPASTAASESAAASLSSSASAGNSSAGSGSNLLPAGMEVSGSGGILTAKEMQITADSFRKLKTRSALWSLEFKGCTFDSDVDFGDLPENVSEITLESCSGITSLKGIEKLGKLSLLTLSDCSVTDSLLGEVDFSSASALNSIDLSGNSSLTDLSPLLKCDWIGYLSISRTNISSLEGIDSFAGLKRLYASDCGIEDLSPLDKISTLEEIDVSGNKLTSLHGLEHSLKLSKIYASRNKLTDLDGIANCTQLTDVSLKDNELKEVGVLTKSISTLAVVDIRNNMLTDLSFITQAPELIGLYADGNEISDISGIKGATALKTFTACNNKITDISAVIGCQNLRDLLLSDNQISDVSPIAGLTADTLADTGTTTLRNLILGHNNISELRLGNAELDNLYLCENPIGKETLSSLPICQNGFQMYVDFPEGLDAEKFLAVPKFYQVYFLNCPLDRQVELENAADKSAVLLYFVETEQELLEKLSNSMGWYGSGRFDDYTFLREADS